MRPRQPISLKEYYLWNGSSSLPWKRQFLNQEFLKFERKRIDDLQKWFDTFQMADENKQLQEVSFYTIPVELSSSWKATIASRGNFNFIGLSVLQNCPSRIMIGLFPYDLKQPEEYRLINIKKSKKSHLWNTRTNRVEVVVIVEDWEYLPSDKIYVDIPFEKRVLNKVFKENLVPNENMAVSFQSPIVSAPHVDGSIGGISLSSIAGNSTFTQELIKTIQLMVPPEYRSFNPPESVFTGIDFNYLKGIKFHFAERPHFDNNFVSSVYDTDYKTLTDELSNRNKFVGEYSIFSTVNPGYGNYTQVWKELLKNFTSTEITLPQDLDEIKEMDVNLWKLKNVINEDLWLQVVNTRQINPSFNEKTDGLFIKTINQIKKDFDILLSDVHKQEVERDYIVRSMLHPTEYNLKRLVQSFGRSNERTIPIEDDFSKARNLMVDNFGGFIKHPQFEKIKIILEKSKNKAGYEIVQTEIINHPKSTTREIFEAVKSTELFRDIYDLQGLLDWLHKNGYVIVDSEKRYMWVGK